MSFYTQEKCHNRNCNNFLTLTDKRYNHIYCHECIEKINNEIPYRIKDLNNIKNIKILEEFDGKCCFKLIEYKNLNFYFYKCNNCNIWYRLKDHPSRLANRIKNNELTQIACSKSCSYILAKKKGICSICGKLVENRDSARRGIECGCSKKWWKNHNDEIHKKRKGPGNCEICGIFNNIRDVNGRGISNCNCSKEWNIQNTNNMRKQHLFLLENNKNYRAKIFKNLTGYNFDREKFYLSKLNFIAFESLDRITKLEDFDKLSSKIGVWSRWTDKNHGNYCLDVCKSNSIGKEMLSSLRSFDSLLKNPEQPLDLGWKIKYKNQLVDAGGYDEENSGKIIFKLVAICENEEEALKIEAQYAYDNKAKYWSPEPGQRKIINF